ncbi:MAG: ABC transporter permease [Chloroflexi bacterium]|nr:ABC transporter permease [Chloroflexota bacterium]MCL5076132.1 ABC transporter permease [Chloroflexota bacterium]
MLKATQSRAAHLPGVSLLRGLFSPLIAIILALGMGALLILGSGVNPLAAYRALFLAAFGGPLSLSEVLVRTIPLLLIGLGLTIAFRCRVWNIGAEGQLYIGALAATWLALTFSDIPGLLLLFLMFVISFLAGAFWGAIPGALKAKFGVSEIITSLMLNYVAFFFVSYLVRVPLKNPQYYLPETAHIPEATQLPILIPKSSLHLGIVVPLLCVPLVYILLWKTVLGYKIRAVGISPQAARYAGINVARYIILAMVLSGGLAGLAGMIEVAGVQYRLTAYISSQYGFTAIVVALLGRLHPVGVLFAAFLFAALIVGADAMQRVVGLSVNLVYVIEGLVVIFVLGSEALRRRRR